MKILMISKYYYPHIGGVEKHLQKVNQLLVKKNKVTVLTERYDKSLSLTEERDGVTISRLSYKRMKFIGIMSIWMQLIKRRKEILSYDIVHIHDVAIWYLPLKIFFPYRKIFLTIHGWEGVFPIPLKNKLLKRIALFISSGSICVGKYVEKYYGIKANRIIYGAVSMESHNAKKKKNGKLIYVGRLEKDTGLEVFLRAVEKLENFLIEFCGDGSLKTSCQQHGIVHGFVDPSRYLEEAEICLCSGYLTILEALANKCLVVAVYNNNLRKDMLQLSPFRDLIFVAGSDREVARIIKSYYKNKETYKTMIQKGYSWAKKQSWKKVVAEYQSLWADL